MKLEIDARESSTRKEHAYSFFASQDFDVNVKQLPIADFLFDKKLAFEYKTVSDFINSVQNHRVFRQMHRIKQYPYHFILIEGNVFEEIHNRHSPDSKYYWMKTPKFTINNYLGALAKLNQHSKVLVVENEHQAFTIMSYLYRNLVEKDENVESIEVPVSQMTDPIGTFLCCCEGVSVKKAVWIKNHLHLENLSDLLEVTHDDLTSVNGIGSKTASNIMEVLK